MWKFIIVLSLVMGLATPSLRQCCPEGTAVLKRMNACWDPKLNKTSPITAITCKIKIKFPEYTLNSKEELVLSIYNNNNITLGHDKFCIGNVTTIKDFELKHVTQTSVVCSEEDTASKETVSGYCMVLSVVFLLITAAIYMALPQMRDLQGKSIICFCCTFALGLGIMAIMKLTTYTDMTLCAIRGFVMYFCILSAFFWTNAIAIQILLSIRRPSTMSYEWRDFVWYAVYAWGTPAMLTLILALVNFLPGNHPRPGIGLMTCWFYDITHQWYYMYSVWSLLLLANICIFIYTSVSLWRSTFSTTHLKALRYKFTLTVRLVIVLGVTWIFEIISSLLDYTTIWLVLDIINVLQGVFIFLVLVVFRKRVLKAMYKRGWLDCMSDIVEKHLAKADDDEQDVVEHTREVPLEDRFGS